MSQGKHCNDTRKILGIAVDETKKTYTLKFEGSSFPNRVGTEQRRIFTIAGDELKIGNPSTSVGGSSELIYKRAK